MSENIQEIMPPIEFEEDPVNMAIGKILDQAYRRNLKNGGRKKRKTRKGGNRKRRTKKGDTKKRTKRR